MKERAAQLLATGCVLGPSRPLPSTRMLETVLEWVLQDLMVSPFSRHLQVPCEAWKACSQYERGVKLQTQVGKVSTFVVALA